MTQPHFHGAVIRSAKAHLLEILQFAFVKSFCVHHRIKLIRVIRTELGCEKALKRLQKIVGHERGAI
jgi:hypothetical protein